MDLFRGDMVMMNIGEKSKQGETYGGASTWWIIKNLLVT
jgi:hypothetical protein